MKKTSIRMAILIPILSVMAIGVVAVVLVVSSIASESTMRITDELIEARVNESTNKFSQISEHGYTMVQSLLPVIVDTRKNSGNPRRDVVNILENILASDPSVVGLWTCWEPDKFKGDDRRYINSDAVHDSTGRYVPYVVRSGDEIIREPLVGYDDPVAGDYYQGARRSGEPYITDPYVYEAAGQEMTLYSIAIPVIEDGEVIGAVGMDISLEEVINTMNAATILEDGYVFVLSTGGLMASHYEPSMLLTSYKDYWLKDSSEQIDEISVNGGHFSTIAHSDVTDTDMIFLGTGVKIGDTQGYWTVCGVVPESTAKAAANQLTLFVVISGAALILLAGLTTLLFINRSLRKLPSITAMAKAIAAGDLSINTVSDDTETRNEITLLERSFADVVRVINSLINDLNGLSRVFSEQGDIEAVVDNAPYSGSYKDVVDGVNGLVGGLIQELLQFMGALTAFGDGDFNADIPKLPGKKAVMNENINAFRETVKTINNDINKLVQSVVDGELRNRADVTAYRGDWSKLAGGMNALMEAVSAPVNEISEVMSRVAQGSFDIKMAGNYRGDFLALKDSVNTTVINISSYIDEIALVLTNLSNNNLDQGITREYVGSFQTIKNAMNNIIDTFNTVISDITLASEQVAAGARSISESSMALATGATEQASSVEELNATVAVISENTNLNAGNARSAETLSNNSKNNAGKGDQDMKDMLKSMNGIKESSNKISKIIRVIEDIAFQTNLLALNAAVEAARAGEQGAGFSVVADEVRSLAIDSQAAAKETASLIAEAIERVEEGMTIADKTADTLGTIVSDIDKVAGLITNIANASGQQAEAVDQVVIGLNQITDVVQNNSATSEESASASQELSSQAEVMRNLVSVFKLKDGK